MSVNIALAQFAPGIDVDENRSVITQFIDDAAAQGADLLILPEYSIYTDKNKERPGEIYSEALDGPFITQTRAATRRAGIHVLLGTLESPGENVDKAYNTLVLIDPSGEIAMTYRKIHLYDAFGYRESDFYLPGELQTPPTFTINGLTFGAITCYDIRFPELTRLLMAAGIDVLAVPAAWATGPGKEMHWEALLRARAIENTVYALGVGQTGPTSTGNSQALDPMGFTVAHAGERPGMVLTEVSARRVQEVRASNPSLDNRRIHLSAQGQR